jgi:glutathione S-transferase
MILYLNPPSPYARKVVMTAHEFGLIDGIELRTVDPWTDPPQLLEAAPAGKVPALEIAPGRVLSESSAICLYLADLHGRSLSPAERLDESIRSGLAQSLIDAGFGIVIERRRPAEAQWTGWIERQQRAITRIVASPKEPVDDRFDLGDIALACGLAYLDFRLPEVSWRQARGDLASWLDRVSERQSFAKSRADQ